MNELKKYQDLIEEYLNKNLLQTETAAAKLLDAMKYSLQAGGKRIRPVFTLVVTELLKGDLHQALPTAAAIEMVHTYSLIHDDLPAMDNDDLRRGLPTCHKKFDEATAILAGDTLQALAYEWIADKSAQAGVAADIIVNVIKDFSSALGLNGMAGGQMLDIINEENNQADLNLLKKIHQLKTGALLKFSVSAPTALFSAAEPTKKALAVYADAIGLAFQIKDDLLDVQGSAAELGKTPGKDLKQGKVTYVSILGQAKAESLLAELTHQAIAAVDIFGQNNLLKSMAYYLLERKK